MTYIDDRPRVTERTSALTGESLALATLSTTFPSTKPTSQCEMVASAASIATGSGSKKRDDDDTAGDSLPTIEGVAKLPKMIRRVIIDGTVIGTLGVIILVFFLRGDPYKRGFNCDDESIRYPYKDNTVSSTVLYLYGFFIPFFVIAFNEVFILRHFAQFHSGSSAEFLKLVGWQFYVQFVPFLFAAGSSQLITDISKYTIGRLRPHFIDLCRPRILSTGEVVDRFTSCSKPFAYYEDYECTNTAFSAHRLRDGHLSFMSGHSSFSAVCLVYTILYIERRVKWRSLGLAKNFLQTLLAALVVYTGLSRISDYKHHWSDVLIGLIQGTIVAVLVARNVSNLWGQSAFFGHRRLPSTASNDSRPSVRSFERSSFSDLANGNGTTAVGRMSPNAVAPSRLNDNNV